MVDIIEFYNNHPMDRDDLIMKLPATLLKIEAEIEELQSSTHKFFAAKVREGHLEYAVRPSKEAAAREVLDRITGKEALAEQLRFKITRVEGLLQDSGVVRPLLSDIQASYISLSRGLSGLERKVNAQAAIVVGSPKHPRKAAREAELDRLETVLEDLHLHHDPLIKAGKELADQIILAIGELPTEPPRQSTQTEIEHHEGGTSGSVYLMGNIRV